MKKSLVGVVLAIALCVLACQDTREELTINPDFSSYKNIGERIPFETGMRWIDFYKSRQNTNGRTNLLSAYEIGDDQVADMLESVTDPVGVALHYGRDAWGVKHIIAIPIDGSLSLFASIPGRIYVDANSGNPISQSVAYTWAMNYRSHNPGGIWFHFFGIDVFDDIFALSFFNSIEIQQALNDILLTEELLLLVWNNEGLLGLGRSKGGDDCAVFDASSPCPPCGVHD